MADYRKRVEKRACRLGLSSDELVLGACLTEPLEGADRRARPVTGAVFGADELDNTVPGHDGLESSLADRMPAQPSILALTNKRLVAFKRSVALQQPTEVACSWELAEVTGLGIEKATLVFQIGVDFFDGSDLQLEGVMASQPMKFIEAWNSQVTVPR